MRLGAVGRTARGLTGQGLRFALVGAVATVVQLGLYAFLSGSVGAQLANICAWLISTLVANAAHHRYTFGLTGPANESDHLLGMLTSVVGLGLSAVALAALDQPTGLSGTVALIAVNAGVGVLRFTTLRWWLIGRRVAVVPAMNVTDLSL